MLNTLGKLHVSEEGALPSAAAQVSLLTLSMTFPGAEQHKIPQLVDAFLDRHALPCVRKKAGGWASGSSEQC